jgi:spore germination protein GerM
VRRAAVAVVVVVLLGACGVSTDEEPRTMSPENVPFGLLEPATSTTTTVLDERRQTGIGIYLVTPDGALVQRPRTIVGEPSPQKAVSVLLEGPNAEEAAANLTTVIPSGTELRAIEPPTEGLVTVDLSSDFLSVTGPRQVQAVAQVVFTLLDVPGVQSVLFRFEGERAEVPDGNGELTAEPLNRSDYRSLRR